MATCLFRSALAFRLRCFVEARKMAGRQGLFTQKLLVQLDRFLVGELKPGETLTREIVERWIKSMESLSVGTRINRICMLRQFSLYLAYFDPRTYIIPHSFLPQRTRHKPHIYTRSEVRRILAAAERMGPAGSLRPAVVSTALGLLYTTGLRMGEALKLTVGDVDLKRRLLLIRETKFGKTRYVPLSHSAVERLRTYLRQRGRANTSISPESPLFINLWGNPYQKPGFTMAFLEVARKIGIRGPKGTRGPRLHDFRHTFAVNRLLAWYRQGVKLPAKLPLLSIYLGHATVTGTETYLHATAELLESVNRRFHSNCAIPPLGGNNAHDKH